MRRVFATAQRGFGSVGLALGLALTAPRAEAEIVVPPDPRLEIGFRSGYVIPFGKVFERSERPDDLDHYAIGQVPIWFDIGARIGKNLFVGGYVQYGVVVFSGAFKRQCEELERDARSAGGESKGECSFHDLRLGAEAQLHLGKPGLLLDPWVGGGIGYEWLSLGMFYELDEPGGQHGNLHETLHGFEFLNLQTGLDFRMADATAFGPFVAFTVSTYRGAKTTCGGDCGGLDHGFESIDDEAFHHWLFFGVRGAFLL